MTNGKTKGKQTKEATKNENSGRHNSFCKRRSNIYKRASELVALTGAEIIVGAFSPSGKSYSFSHPSIEAVANRFLGRGLTSSGLTQSIMHTEQSSRIQELTQEYNEAACRLDSEEQRGKELQQKLKGKHAPGWWSVNIEELNMEELLQIRADVEAAESKLWESLANDGGASTSKTHHILSTS